MLPDYCTISKNIGGGVNMSAYYYIYAEIGGDQYLIGYGKHEMINRWYDMLVAYKSPNLIAIVSEHSYFEYSVHDTEHNEILLNFCSDDGYEKHRLKKYIKLGKDVNYIDPYDLDHDWYKLLLQYQAYQREREAKIEKWRKEDEEWNALSEEEQKRMQDEYIAEALRISRKGRDDE